MAMAAMSVMKRGHDDRGKNREIEESSNAIGLHAATKVAVCLLKSF